MFGRFMRWITATESSASFAQQIIGLLGWIGVASVGSYASMEARVTDWMTAYGPVGWILLGVGVALICALIFRVTAAAINGIANARLVRAYTIKSRRINPLQLNFENEVIDISDFYSPGPMLYKNKTFTGCEIRGPGTISLAGHTHMMGAVGHINAIEQLNQEIDVTSIVVFENARFVGCRFFRVTLLGAPGLRERVYSQSGRGKSQLSDQPANPVAPLSSPLPADTEEKTQP